MCIMSSWEMTEAAHIMPPVQSQNGLQVELLFAAPPFGRRLPNRTMLPSQFGGQGGYMSDLSWPRSTNQTPLDMILLEYFVERSLPSDLKVRQMNIQSIFLINRTCSFQSHILENVVPTYLQPFTYLSKMHLKRTDYYECLIPFFLPLSKVQRSQRRA